MKDKLLKAIELYINYCKKNNLDHHSHTTLGNLHISAYIPDSWETNPTYAEIKACGIEVNINGRVAIDYDHQEPQPIDFDVWIETVLDILIKEQPRQEWGINDFFLKVDKEILLSRGEYFAEENRTKAKILDNLLKRDVSFSNIK